MVLDGDGAKIPLEKLGTGIRAWLAGKASFFFDDFPIRIIVYRGFPIAC